MEVFQINHFKLNVPADEFALCLKRYLGKRIQSRFGSESMVFFDTHPYHLNLLGYHGIFMHISGSPNYSLL